MMRKFLLVVLIVAGGLVIWNWSLLVYGVEQGTGQLKIVWYARPVSEVMSDPEFPDSLMSRLLLIEDIRKFAIDSLGLKDTKN